MEKNRGISEASEDALCKIVDRGAGQKLQRQQQLPGHDAFNFRQTQLDTVVTAAEDESQVVNPLVSVQHRVVPFNDINTAFEFETPLFKGTALLLLRNMANTPKGVFEGKRRQMVWTVQGRFKQPAVSLDTLMLGSDFTRPLRLPASALLTQAISWVASKLGGGVSVNVAGRQPHILAPLIAAAQVVHVAQPGQEPDLCGVHEDMRLFDARLVNSWTGKPFSSKQRRAHFSAAANRRGRVFDCHHVWTFQMYEHLMDYNSFLLNLPLFKLDMVQLFDGQPLQLMLKDWSNGAALLHLTVWHRRMLDHPANQPQAASPRGVNAQGPGFGAATPEKE